MSAGTLTLTSNSAAVVGIGTSFSTELAAGDFVVVTVGGVPYTLPVKTVNSNTSLTLVSNFTGPTQAGAAWSSVPRVALNMVTAALVAQSAEALRGLNYDKQNWQSIFSGTGTVTVKLPDGSTWSGPAWNGIATTLTGKMDKSQNLNDVADKVTARTNLGLGSSATRNALSATGDMLSREDFGIGGKGYLPNATINYGCFLASDVGAPGYAPTNGGGFIVGYQTERLVEVWVDNTGSLWSRFITGSGGASASNSAFIWKKTLNNSTTTVDSNGFIKSASPIVKIYSSGKFETNEESEGVVASRISVGEYLITGCVGLNSDASWGGIDGGFEIPTDRNKQPLIWLDYEVSADGSVLVKTYHRAYMASPSFARNDIDGVRDGEPVDIPEDQFISVRVEMPQNSIWNQRQDVNNISMEHHDFDN